VLPAGGKINHRWTRIFNAKPQSCEGAKARRIKSKLDHHPASDQLILRAEIKNAAQTKATLPQETAAAVARLVPSRNSYERRRTFQTQTVVQRAAS
jgi:hypothetical protein